jgi:hypothetical protein
MGTWGRGATPGDGFISRLSAEGRVLDLKWITGFESPKGLALANGRLYVGDDAELVEIDPATGTIVARHAPPWAKVDLARTGAPNGLHADRDRLLLGSWVAQGAAGQANRFGIRSSVSYADQTVTPFGSHRIGNIDGIEPDDRGGYTVTDWVTGQVLRVTTEGVPTPLLTLKQGAADHEYVIEQRLLVVPLVLDGVVRAFRWEP